MSKTAPGNSFTPCPYEQIVARAYERWLQSGCATDHNVETRKQAEARLRETRED